MLDLMNSLNDFFIYEFLAYAFIGTMALALTTALISPLIIARKNSFIGTAVSHSTLLGLSLGLLFFGAEKETHVFLTTLLVTGILTSMLARPDKSKLPDDSKLGLFYTSSMALGILIYSIAIPNKNDLINFLFGNILLLSNQDLWLIFSILVLTIICILIPLKKWLLVTIDPVGSKTRGINPDLFHVLFYLLLTFIIVVSIKLAGTLLIETMILAPGFFALSFAKNLKQTFIISIIFALVTAPVGLILANFYSLPSGATLAVIQVGTLLLALSLKFIYDRLR